MVHHHHVRLLGALARLHDETLLVVLAFLAQAVLARGSHVRPDAGVFRHCRKPRLVAGRARLGETLYQLEMRHVLAIAKAAVRRRAFQMMMADVVGAALEQRDGHRCGERLAHHGQVAIEELVLQGLGAGGDDDLAAGQQRRHEVGEGFAGTRAGLDDQLLATLDGTGNRLGHF